MYSVKLGLMPFEQTQAKVRSAGMQVLARVAALLPAVCKQMSGH